MASIGSLSRAVSGLMANQRALNATAHNLSNVDTQGFVRQQVLFKDSSYVGIGNNFQVGLGTDIQSLRQVRDIFLDRAYRDEAGRLGFYDSKYQAVAELEIVFGEIGGESFSTVLDDLWKSINELSKHPEGLETRGTFVQSATMFINRVNLISNQMNDYQMNLNTQVVDMVKEINGLGDTIHQLNEAICKYEAYGDNANDLRDQRNNALDRLSYLVDITYREDATGKVSVNIEGMNFVSNGRVSHLGLEQAEPNSPMVKPVWKEYDKDLFSFHKEIKPENDNDKGALKGLLLARGTRAANYTDLENAEHYNKNIKPSVVMNAQAQFDKLVNGIVTLINDTLAPNKDGVLDDEAPYGLDGSRGTEIFKRQHYNRYDADGNVIGTDNTDIYTLYTSGNIIVNPAILQDYDKIALSKVNGAIGDNSIIEKLINNWNKPFGALEPGATSQMNFNEYYASFISGLGNTGNLAINMQKNQQIMVNQIDNQRSQLMGVSSDEELGNMMKYQHAYNANAKVVNAIDEMMEHIITRVGIVGR
ncbi:flagellar hook-associated protein 1 FlgK [Natranaerovirga pectinivora]|uniref:Flagellar hook-associated protein 1 n=1 Tax=Natranaerovirga pectinivora TaxID=682400 RepID=A0A4R3MJU9_9FIRM|nr:flagellar hook-associated protein FlgK [Natranaerovirga pectinivora]TCT14014.1 flagellar hook-associated protein 1 FlgK [Natranaerovirga pectinivora]